MKTPFPVLIVDDESAVLNSFEMSLRCFGIDNIICTAHSGDALQIIESTPVDAMILDLCMPGISGQDILHRVTRKLPDLPVIVATGVESIESAVECMKVGAFDYLAKPVEEERLVASVRTALELSRLRRENSSLRQCFVLDTLQHPEAFAHFITASTKMRQIFQYLEAIRGSSQPILIMGETGVGKELVARAVHNLGCPDFPFMAVNVAGLDDMMFSDTLFGHRKGAFTGAVSGRKGLVEQAGEGILFLDEIGDLGEASQVKLLRLIQEREYLPLGADIPRPSEARVVVATHHDLEDLVEKGMFRKDLYYRLCTHQVRIPPLRERHEDIPVLVDLFLKEAAGDFDKPVPVPDPVGMCRLCEHEFPGNVRELRGMVFDAVGRWTGGAFHVRDEPEFPDGASVMTDRPIVFPEPLPTIDQTVEVLVGEAMRRAGGKQTAAARMLGISQPALSKRLNRRKRS
jgi:DNA-binding NtrC family response regulator